MLLSLVSLAWAAEPPASEPSPIEEGRPVKYKERTEIIFDDSLHLEGELVGPDGIRVDNFVRPRFNPLIQLRTDWNRELLWSIDDVK